jgi:hypothetical protein
LDGSSAAPTIEMARASAFAETVIRAIAALCLGLLVAALLWGHRYRNALVRLAPNPAVFLFAVGAAWWWLLTPSLLGALIVALAAVLGFRNRFAASWRPARAPG